MSVLLRGGRLYDPTHGRNGVRRNLYLDKGRIRHRRPPGKIEKTYELDGMAVMAGAIDAHTHIGGGKMNLGRLLLPEDQRQHPRKRQGRRRSGGGRVVPTSFTVGYRYAELGYTSCFEPAMLPANARQLHLEFADIPLVDKGCYVVLGNDDYLLRLLGGSRPDPAHIRDYVAWMLNATGALAVKVVNPGGINAFKYNQRRLDLDEPNCAYGVTPRRVLLAIARAVRELGIAHPPHLHGCNLGMPGSAESTLRTIEAADGLPLHLTHLQFHSYGAEGDYGYSSGAARIAEQVNRHRNVSIDVGQVMFGQTLTASSDTMHQYAASRHARPRRWLCMDIECEAGCGVLPFRYRHESFVNALQWAIGLELFLSIEDPWRIFLTTDHPNGAPFDTYPHVIRLLMDRSFRNDALAQLHPEAARMSALPGIDREYSLYEIAIVTRAAPARSLGLRDRGHLGDGAAADIAVYRPHANPERMFARPEYVFKDGRLVARKGKVIAETQGNVHRVRPAYDKAIERRLRPYWQRYYGMQLGNFFLGEDEAAELYVRDKTQGIR